MNKDIELASLPFAWTASDPQAAGATVMGHATPSAGRSGGDALEFDGFSAFISIPMTGSLPSGAFSVTVDLAVAAYPWNDCPLFDAMTIEEDGAPSGFRCLLGDRGTPCFSLVTQRGTYTALGDEALALDQWHQLHFTYKPDESLTIFLDGRQVARTSIAGRHVPSQAVDILIGKTRRDAIATGPIRPYAHLPFTIYFDGRIENVVITTSTDDPRELSSVPANLTPRRLPAGPAGPGRFGATYEHLKYYESWDRRWRVGDFPDVLARFDNADYRVVFWRGTNYIPCWVSGDDIWYTNEFNETWGNGATGCAEPMSDKHCAYSHVRIIESNDARVVVHWRYALVDVLGVRPRKDPVSGWSDFTDEIYTIYPDGTAIRSITLHSTQPMESHEFQESIVVLGPGQRPEDVLEIEPVTLANMNGETRTYSWANGRPRHLPEPKAANIVRINTKSPQKPYFIVSPEPCLTRDDGPQPAPLFPPYHHETLSDGMLFPWWNHWPTSDIPSDGRRAVAADRASHSSVLTGSEWADYEVTPTSRRRIMLHGLTEANTEDLLPLARSWLAAPVITALSGAEVASFDMAEKAYVLQCDPQTASIDIAIAAEPQAPLINPAFLLQRWSGSRMRIFIDGEEMSDPIKCRIGFRHTAGRSDAIVWLQLDASKRVTISFRS